MVGRKTVAGVRGAGGTSSLHPKSQTICLDERNMYIVYHATMSCHVHTVHLDTRNIGFLQMFRDSTKSAHFGKHQTSCLWKISKKLPKQIKFRSCALFLQIVNTYTYSMVQKKSKGQRRVSISP